MSASPFTSSPRPALVDRTTPIVIYGKVAYPRGEVRTEVLKLSTLGERDADFDHILATRPDVLSAWCGKAGGWARVTQAQPKLLGFPRKAAANHNPSPGPGSAA